MPWRMVSLASSVAGATAVMLWRVRETQRPVTVRKIVVPPVGMATGFGMFLAPAFRIPWGWALMAFLAGAVVLAYPLIRTSRLIRDGDVVMMRRSSWFFAILVGLAIVRIAARGYLDTIMSVQQTAGIFFVLAFGMILRWRAQMYFAYRSLLAPTVA